MLKEAPELITKAEAEAMRELRLSGATIQRIKEVTGRSLAAIRDHTACVVSAKPRKPKWETPEEALAERQYAFSHPITTTAAFCGDPLPGRSALDKLKASGRRL
jgi:hypothetical protein